jgi:exportin-7
VLANKGPRLAVFAQASLVTLVCRLTKFAWLDEGAAIKEIAKETTKFLQATFPHCVIGLRLLNELVSEMNYKNKNRTLNQHRKVAVSFRDVALLEVFETSLSMLNQLATKALPFLATDPNAAAYENQLLDQTLTLLTSCLSFDFIGVLPDESSDDSAVLQVPSTWKERIQSGTTLRLLFNVYKGCTTGRIPIIPDGSAPPVVSTAAAGAAQAQQSTVFGPVGQGPTRDFPISQARAAQTLECLSLMISVRKSLFSNEAETKRFLTHIMRGVCEILREKYGLADVDCFHRFCRLLTRIKNNQQLNDLMRAEGYAEWLSLMADFSIAACRSPEHSSNSMGYILSIWARLVASVPYANIQAGSLASASRGGAPSGAQADSLLGLHVPSIVGAYVRGRVEQISSSKEALQLALSELEDLEQIEDQLESLPTLCRFEFSTAATMIISIVDPIMKNYEAVLTNALSRISSGQLPSQQEAEVKAVLECQLAWMVAIIGSIIGGGGAHSSSIHAHSMHAAILRSVGASIGADSSEGAPGEEFFDAELCRRVFQLMSATNNAVEKVAQTRGLSLAQAAQDAIVLSVRVDRRLDVAMLHFVDQFRKAFITDASGMPSPPQGSGEAAWVAAGGSARGAGDASSSSMALLRQPRPGGVGAGHSPSDRGSMNDMPSLMSGSGTGHGVGGTDGRAPTSYAEMLETATGRQRTFLNMFKCMGLGEHPEVVTHIVLKLANNLRFWGDDDTIIKRSNEVLRDMVHSFSSGRLLLTIPQVAAVLREHGPAHFPFLLKMANARHRTSFYSSLARLVFFEDDSERFEPFIAPLLAALEGVRTSIRLRDERVAMALLGSARDLRGVLQAAHNRAAYCQVFDALHPQHLETLAVGLEAWADQPQVSTAVLKFFSELVLNRGSRIQFPVSSPNGVLLFKRAAQAVVGFGHRLLSTPLPPPDQVYKSRYKGIALCAQILARCIEGCFVNFGVLDHYKDSSFSDALGVVLRLLLGVKPEDLLAHPKLAVQYMTVVHYVVRSHLDLFAALPREAFAQVMRSLQEGLDSLDQDVTTQAAFALDQLASQFVRQAKKDSPAAAALRGQIMQDGSLFPRLMEALLKILVYSEQANHYTLARPLLPVLIAANSLQPDVLSNLIERHVAAQTLPESQQRMRTEFEGLFRDITMSLDVLNRDRFLQRLSAFRMAVRDFATPVS